MSDPGTGLLDDERGVRSTARALLWLVVLFALGLIAVDTFTACEVPGPAYVFLGGVVPLLCMGAWAPRVAQYIGPAIGGFAGALTDAVFKRREPTTGTETTP